MIPRYSRPAMVQVWEPQTRFRIWFEIEAHACDAMAELGVIPRASAEAIWDKAGDVVFDVARIDEIERVTKHDVIAFLTHLAEFIGPESRFVHQGMTSSDVLDTCLAVQLARAADILIADVDALLDALKTQALRPQDDADHRALARHPRRARHLRPQDGAGPCRIRAVSARGWSPRARKWRPARSRGAVGTFANIDPRIEAHVAAQMGLQVEPVSTQVIPRDRHAMFFATLGVVASCLERLAIEIRHMQRTEVLEAEGVLLGGGRRALRPCRTSAIRY